MSKGVCGVRGRRERGGKQSYNVRVKQAVESIQVVSIGV